MKTAKLNTYDVFRVENRNEGREDHIGTIQAENADDAIDLANLTFEYRPTERLELAIVTN